jgi:hypothetical protein
MTRNVPDKERQKLSAEVSLLESLDVEQLRARWKILFETEAPTRFSRDLLMHAVAYRMQERVLAVSSLPRDGCSSACLRMRVPAGQ